MPESSGNGRRTWGGAGLLAVLTILFIVYQLGAMAERNGANPDPIKEVVAGPALAPLQPRVFVTGRVRRPGVYQLAPDSRVQDAIQKAGGPLPDGDPGALNLAAWVQDGSQIVVPARRKASDRPAVSSGAIRLNESGVGGPFAGLPRELPPADPALQAGKKTRKRVPAKGAISTEPTARPTTAPKPTPTEPFDLNEATTAQLETLPGVGPRMAEAIVADRNQHGNFQTVGDLERVKGVGPRKVALWRDYLYVR